jgi:hypothetical protein
MSSENNGNGTTTVDLPATIAERTGRAGRNGRKPADIVASLPPTVIPASEFLALVSRMGRSATGFKRPVEGYDDGVTFRLGRIAVSLDKESVAGIAAADGVSIRGQRNGPSGPVSDSGKADGDSAAALVRRCY